MERLFYCRYLHFMEFILKLRYIILHKYFKVGYLMELKAYLQIIKKRIWLLISITLLFTIIGTFLSIYYFKPQYKSSISIFIGSAKKSSDTQQTYNDFMMYQNLVQTYAEFATSRSVASNVIKNLNLNITDDKLISMLTATQSKNTQFLDITVTSTDRNEAAKIANQLPISLKVITSDIMDADNIKIVDLAATPTTPFSPNRKLNIFIAFIIGITFSTILIFLLEYLEIPSENSVKPKLKLTQ